MEPAAATDGERSIGHQPFASRCYAPEVSLYFDVRGKVIACCQNTKDVLGDVNESSLESIWRGPRAAALRRRLRSGAFGDGCQFCAWEADQGVRPGFLELFDRHPVPSDDDGWPSLMEFALSNRCNLACVMCNGDYSSTIRARRERRPPLPLRYDDEFFDQLVAFLPHLRQARFFGGEPFLVPEYQRIWDQMIGLGLRTECNVTTNGTVLTTRVRETLEQLPFSIGISVDGTTRTTVEAIRVGADHGELLANLEWFHRYCRRQGTPFGLTYCLMRQNWQEFGEFLQWAESLGSGVAVNTVVYPPHASLFRLTSSELEAVLDGLAATKPRLDRLEDTWQTEWDRLVAWRDQLASRTSTADGEFFERWGEFRGPATPVPVALGPTSHTATSLTLAAAQLRLGEVSAEPPSRIDVTSGNLVEDVTGPTGAFLGIGAADLVGRPFPEAMAVFEATFGTLISEEDEHLAANAVERRITFRSPTGEVTEILCITLVGDDGRSTTVAVRSTDDC